MALSVSLGSSSLFFAEDVNTKVVDAVAMANVSVLGDSPALSTDHTHQFSADSTISLDITDVAEKDYSNSSATDGTGIAQLFGRQVSTNVIDFDALRELDENEP